MRQGAGWPHKFICHKPGMGVLLSTQFTEKETEASGKARGGQAAFRDSVSLVAKVAPLHHYWQ